MKTNVEATKRQLQQRKFKKFINLKYKPQLIKEKTPAITQANFKKSNANAVKGGTNMIDPEAQHLRKTSNTNIQEEPATLLKRLELLHQAHAQRRRGKSPARVPSTTNQTSTDRDIEIEDLRNQIKLLKQNQKNVIRKSNLNILRIRKNIPSQKTFRWPPPQEAILKPTSIC